MYSRFSEASPFLSEDSSLGNSPEFCKLQGHPCLVKPYPFLLNNAGSDFSHMVWMESCKWLYCLKLSPQLFICMQLVECRLGLKTYGKMKKNISLLGQVSKMFLRTFLPILLYNFYVLTKKKNEHFLLQSTDSKSIYRFISCKDA